MSASSSYRCIGRGNCGTVWAREGNQDYVYKREDGAPTRSVQNDSIMHKRVLSIIGKDTTTALPVRISNSYEVYEASDDEPWKGTDLAPCRTYHMERIPAMPQPVRQLLIDTYCPEALQDSVSNNRDDEDCLVRVYLGRRRIQRPSRFQRFSLRNFPLHVDQMEVLGIDTHGIARALADTLAYSFWETCVDLNDVEFVLAPKKDPHPASVPLFEAFDRGRYPVWMLDYDCCRSISLDEEGMKQAVTAFYRNDPYYPRPYAHGYTEADGRLWQTFRTQYLEKSRELLKKDEERELADMFIELVEAEGRARSERAKKEDVGL